MGAGAPTSIEVGVRGVRADAVSVDALARLQLHAGRHGFRLLLRGASAELLELISFMGLADVLATWSYPVEPQRR
jgi:hypothetical protein